MTKTFREWLRATRGDRTQRAVAARCPSAAHIDQTRIAKWEGGQGRPSFVQLAALLDAMDADSAARAGGEALWRSEELACLSAPAAV